MTTGSADVLRRFLLCVGLAALVVAALQISVGGFGTEVFGLRVSNNSLTRPLLVALFAAAVLVRREWRAATLTDIGRLDTLVERVAPSIAAIAAATAFLVGVFWGTHAAGGSDSYCYIGQAEAFAAGRSALVEPLVRQLNLPRADLVFAPVGFIPGARGGAVPMCAPGLSLVMALAWKAGGDTLLHYVVPCLGALAVWCAFVLGRRLLDSTSGACAAMLLCASPVFLYQVVQPMSDVPAAAFWAAALALLARGDARGQKVAGIAASFAILTRPNLAPALIPLAAFAAVTATRRGLTRFIVTMIPGSMLLVWLNYLRYGSPLRTGYGDLGDLFSLSHVLPNTARYSEWTIASQTPLILLTFAAPFVVRGRAAPEGARQKALAWMGLAFVLVVLGCYLPYTVFDAWWYTRFLLPALPVALALTASTLVALASRARLRSVILVPVMAALVSGYVAYARSHDAFRLRDFERRFITAGTLVGRTLPENAVVITIQQSGAVRHYGRRPAALWDALAPDALDETVAGLQRAGKRPYLLLEDWEEPGFRERFKGQQLGALDWSPAAEIRDHVTVRIYDPAERLPSARERR